MEMVNTCQRIIPKETLHRRWADSMAGLCNRSSFSHQPHLSVVESYAVAVPEHPDPLPLPRSGTHMLCTCIRMYFHPIARGKNNQWLLVLSTLLLMAHFLRIAWMLLDSLASKARGRRWNSGAAEGYPPRRTEIWEAWWVGVAGP